MFLALLLLACSSPVRGTLDGSVIWNVDFDAVNEGAGLADCSFTRTYVGVEDHSTPWLCLGCEQAFLADVDMEGGFEDCQSQVAAIPMPAQEWVGLADGRWFRGGLLAGDAAVQGDDVEVTQVIDPEPFEGGTVAFSLEGTLRIGEEEGDPLDGWDTPDTYACGWPKADPRPYRGDYSVTPGSVLPDGILDDACGERVRLHDFAGRYLVVSLAAMDCPRCQVMAEEEPAFLATMAAEGIEVEVVTLLAPSLTDTSGTPTQDQLLSYVDTYGLDSPVLADRGWGVWVAEPGIDQFAYPTSMLVDPDLQILQRFIGFDSFDTLESAIRRDAR